MEDFYTHLGRTILVLLDGGILSTQLQLDLDVGEFACFFAIHIAQLWMDVVWSRVAGLAEFDLEFHVMVVGWS